jgi:hypothetical protein
MKKLGDVISLGIWEGVLKTLKGKYFKSIGSNSYYFYFPETNINTPLDVNFENNFRIYSNSTFGNIKLRIVRYNDDVFNPTKIETLIPLSELFIDYIEITKEQFNTATEKLQKEIDKYK